MHIYNLDAKFEFDTLLKKSQTLLNATPNDLAYFTAYRFAAVLYIWYLCV